MIEKGTWVEIEKIVLLPKDRAKNIPKETKDSFKVLDKRQLSN